MQLISWTSHESIWGLLYRKICLACGSDSINNERCKYFIWCQHLQSDTSVLLLQPYPCLTSCAGVLPEVADGADGHGRAPAGQVHRDNVFQARLPWLSLHHVHANNDLRKNYTTPSVSLSLFFFLYLKVRSDLSTSPWPDWISSRFHVQFCTRNPVWGGVAKVKHLSLRVLELGFQAD